MLFYARTKCSFTVTFTNDTVAMTSVFMTVFILTVVAASVRPTKLTFSLALLCLKKTLSYIHCSCGSLRVSCCSHYFILARSCKNLVYSLWSPTLIHISIHYSPISSCCLNHHTCACTVYQHGQTLEIEWWLIQPTYLFLKASWKRLASGEDRREFNMLWLCIRLSTRF